MFKYEICKFIKKYKTIFLVLASIILLLAVCWTISFWMYYVSVFQKANIENKLSAMTTLIALIIGQTVSIIFISIQIASGIKNVTYSKKYDAINQIIDDIHNITDKKVYTLQASREELKNAMYKIVSRNPIKIDYYLVDNIDTINEKLEKHFKNVNETEIKVRDVLNDIDKNELKHVESTIKALNDMFNTLSKTVLLTPLASFEISQMRLKLSKLGTNLNETEQKQMYSRLGYIEGLLYPKKDFMGCARELNISLKQFKDAKHKNR